MRSIWRRLARLAVAQRLGAQPDGAIQRADQLGCEPLNGRIFKHRKPVRDQLRMGQQIAKIMIDLADGEAQLRQPALLFEQVLKLALHLRQFTFRTADFISPVGRRHHDIGQLRTGGKKHHVFGDPLHRPDHHGVECKEHETGDDEGDDDRQPENVVSERQHRIAKRRLIKHDLNERGIAPRDLAPHSDDAGRRIQQNRKRLHDLVQHA